MQYRRSRPAPGCPEFGETTVLFRPEFYGEEPSVKPGIIQPRQGAHEVVWWDPAALKLTVEGKLGLRRHDILSGDSEESSKRYEEWQSQREQGIAASATPEWEIVNPSEAGDAPDAVTVESLSTAPLGDRPGGRRFGTLVHMVLRDAGFDGSSVDRFAKAHGRALGADSKEIEAAAEAALAALGHPLFDHARAAEHCFRELPLTWKLEDMRIVEGSIDLAFIENGRWQVVDFKTDAHVAAKRSQYERQLRWYAAALTHLTGQPCDCYLLSI